VDDACTRRAGHITGHENPRLTIGVHQVVEHGWAFRILGINPIRAAAGHDVVAHHHLIGVALDVDAVARTAYDEAVDGDGEGRVESESMAETGGTDDDISRRLPAPPPVRVCQEAHPPHRVRGDLSFTIRSGADDNAVTGAGQPGRAADVLQ